MIGVRLIMHAAITRDVAIGKDKWGQPVPPDYQPLAVARCFAWSPAAKDVIDGDKVAATQDVRVMFAIGTDVNEDDVVSQIADHQGNILFAGPLRIDGPVQYKHNHLEAALVRVA